MGEEDLGEVCVCIVSGSMYVTRPTRGRRQSGARHVASSHHCHAISEARRSSLAFPFLISRDEGLEIHPNSSSCRSRCQFLTRLVIDRYLPGQATPVPCSPSHPPSFSSHPPIQIPAHFAIILAPSPSRPLSHLPPADLFAAKKRSRGDKPRVSFPCLSGAKSRGRGF